MKFQAIKKVYPNAVSLTVRSNTGEEIVKDADGSVLVIDSSLVDAELAKLQADYDANQYQRDRKYPELGEQFDLLFKDIDSGKVNKDGGFYKAIKAVKDKHPKPSE